MEYIPKYKIAFPDKQYRRYPMTFLNNETWENELENTKTQTQNINLDTWN